MWVFVTIVEMGYMTNQQNDKRRKETLWHWMKNIPWRCRREWYHRLLESLKKELNASQGESELVMRLDDAVGEYSGHYGETAYVLGFHDGLEIGMEHGKQYGAKDNEDVEMV